MVDGVLVSDKDIVVPGQVLAEGMDFLPGSNVLRDGNQLIATKLGLAQVSNRLVKLVPLVGGYIPKKGDMVIGKIASISTSGWRVDFGWPFEALLSIREASNSYIPVNGIEDMAKVFNFGDEVIVLITNVFGNKIVDVSAKAPGLRKLGPGRLVRIEASKVPRVIGKQGSMINMIKEYTGCKVLVGQNGIVWLSGPDAESELLAVQVIKKIEDESHISGLTDRIKAFFEERK